MRLLRLSLTGFRNLADQTLRFPDQGVAIVGPNAQGKTNLLEACHYLETFRSMRGARDEQLTRIGGAFFRVEAELAPESVASERMASERMASESEAPEHSTPEHEPPVREAPVRVIAAAYAAATREKRITRDGKSPARISDAIGGVGSVLFTPEDVRLVSEGPAERRYFLDVLLSLNEPAYLSSLRRFRQALVRRNAALRRGEGLGSVAAWDEGLVRAGAEVSAGRARWIADRSGSFSSYYGEIAGGEIAGRGSARMSYEPSIPGGTDVDAVREAYGAALEHSRETDRRLRATQTGPHRDELRFYIDAPEGERDARELGSGGERRTVALALRLLEVETVRERRGSEPILLLDDLFAELDEDRSRRMLDLLDRSVPGQVVLTAPKGSDVRFRSGALERWTIQEGTVATHGRVHARPE